MTAIDSPGDPPMAGDHRQRALGFRAKVCNHAKTTPPNLSYPLCRCPIQPSVRNLIG